MAGQGIRIGIKILGMGKADLKLQALKREAEKTKPLYNKAIIILEQSEAKTFRKEGRPRWKVSERAAAVNGQTLQKTGRLRQSVTGRSRHSIREFKGKTLAFGTKLIYGPAHQFGYPPHGLPKRPFLGVYDEDIKKMEQVFGKDLEGRFKVVASG